MDGATPSNQPAAPPGWRPCTAGSLRCEYWTWSPDYLRPDCCTHALRTLLAFTEELLTRHGLPHWLDYGALLGAVRGGAFVPWDSDVDWGVFRDDLRPSGPWSPRSGAPGTASTPATRRSGASTSASATPSTWTCSPTTGRAG